MGMAVKRFRSIWSFGAAFALLPAMVSSTATVTVNFQGSFINPTCNFSVNGGNSTNLGTYPNTYFNTSTLTPVVQLPITATGCSAGVVVAHMVFSGTADSSNNQLFAVNSGSGVAGVGIQLLNNAQTSVIPPGGTLNWTSINPSGSSTYIMWTRFSKTTGPITAGTANVPITINFTYN